MLRNITLAAFLFTVAVIVPVGWHASTADIQVDGKRLRPLQQSFTVDGTRITLDADRQEVMTGDTVKATLVAYSDTPKQITVDLTALHTSNYEGSRVETPWTPFDHETIKLSAAPGGGVPFDTAIKLGERPDAPALVDSFKLYVTAHGHKPPRRGDDDERPDYDAGVSEGTAAAIAINGWSGNNLGMTIRAEGRPTGDAPFTIAVRVANQAGQKLARAPRVYLSTEDALMGHGDDKEDAAIEIEEASDEAGGAASDDGDAAFARGAVMVKRFRVTPKKPGLKRLTLLASAYESDDEPGPATAGGKEARTFTLTESAPAMAAR
jgi:hypothetical protein